ncbi:hypothetical protein PENTCL1PPCAC_22152, partial [Pristionchus entomophagus]
SSSLSPFSFLSSFPHSSTMRSGLLLLSMLILILLSLPLFFAGSSTNADPNPEDSTEDKKNPTKEEDKDSCIPPVFVVIFFTAYGIFLMGLFIYGGKQWIGLVEAKFKLRKLMALEVALIHYDKFCERHELHGRAELFVPALNDGFFMDPDVQEAWLSVNNLRQCIYKVPTSDYKHIMKENWDVVKRRINFRKKKVDEELRNTEKKGDGPMLKLNLHSLCLQLLTTDLFNPSAFTKPAEEQAAEGSENQPGTSQIKEVDGSAEKNLMEPGKKETKKDSSSDPKRDKKAKKDADTKEKKDSASDPKKEKKGEMKDKKSEEKELDKKDEKKEEKE